MVTPRAWQGSALSKFLAHRDLCFLLEATVQKREKRTELSKAARRLALQLNPDQPDYKAVWSRLYKTLGVRSLDDMMDNHSLTVMEQAVDLVSQWLRGNNAAA